MSGSAATSSGGEAAAGSSGLDGARVGITADRRWEEQAELLRRRGAQVIHGPTLVTVDLSHEEALRQVTLALVEQPPDLLLVTTGLGVRLWFEAAAAWGVDDRLRAALAGSEIIARGAKAASTVRRAGLEVSWRAPRETMDEVVEHVAGRQAEGRRVAVQLFAPEDHPSTASLRALAGELVEVPVYRWRLPEDLDPARRLVEATIAGELDAVTFTSQPAVHHLARIAESSGHGDELRRSFNSGVVAACVGPVCAEAARAEGIDHPVWPEPPRLVAMIRQLGALLAARRTVGGIRS
ncbi:MAG: uroporphyrinogen-III synthase [Actinomycetota bacterium]|nr:uroporphyrinogen-III synthase [Actinomycetota bacterium]